MNIVWPVSICCFVLLVLSLTYFQKRVNTVFNQELRPDIIERWKTGLGIVFFILFMSCYGIAIATMAGVEYVI